VTLLSGGGSGHEPTHAGFVGEGLLDAAVAGTIFASPSTKQIAAGLNAIASEKGTLIVVKNYTGDIIHFGLAAERMKAQGHEVEVVIVGDDVAVGKTQGGLVGRRGLAGTVLVHKIAGAAAEAGKSLKEVAAIARAVVANTVTVGASLDHCNVPGRQFETNLSHEEIEIGMGIHNEPGVHKESPVPSVPDLIASLLPLLLSQEDKERAFVPFAGNDDVILVVNNLGGISNLELSYATEVATNILKEKYNISPARTITGAFITALNGPGFSLTLLNASRARAAVEGHPDILGLFDAPARASGWNQHAKTNDWTGKLHITEEAAVHKSTEKSGVTANPKVFTNMLEAAIENVMKVEPKVTEYDTIAGDGDAGETLVSGGNAIRAALKTGEIRLDDGVNSISDIAEVVESSMGGTSGGIYSIFLSALAQGVRDSGAKSLNVDTFRRASQQALNSLYAYTKARIGDRTLIDALAPFVHTLSETADFGAAVRAADEGANSTRKLEAKFGRASYVSPEELKKYDGEGGLPDPGAIGLAALLDGLLRGYNS
jgi:dihydroxyacetone kinase